MDRTFLDYGFMPAPPIPGAGPVLDFFQWGGSLIVLRAPDAFSPGVPYILAEDADHWEALTVY